MAADLAIILPFIGLAALLYASVGHGGATAYLAILSLAGYALDGLATTVLVLNILAAGIAFVQFQQAGHLRREILVPFVVTSVPAAFVGGLVAFAPRVQAILLGVALLAAALRLALIPAAPKVRLSTSSRAFLVAAPTAGAVLGFLAGATGIGGGVFLSPVLVFAGWADVKQAGSVASAFIVVNSLAGLVARVGRVPIDAGLLGPLAVVVVLGAVAGGFLGAFRIPRAALQRVLGVVLALAAVKQLVP